MEYTLEIIRNVSVNIITLFFVVFLSNYLNKLNQNKLRKHTIFSFFIGFAYFIIISTGVSLSTTAIFDARVVLAIMTGFYFDFVPGLVGAIIGSSYRLALGGSGAYGGVISIIAPFTISVLCRYKIKKVKVDNEFHIFALSLFSVFAHLILTLPIRGLGMITVSYLIIYFIIIPILTVIINLFFLNILKYQSLEEIIKEKDLIHKASIDSIKSMEIFAVDKNYNYLFKNGMHEDSMISHYHTDINGNYLDLVDPLMKDRIKNNIDISFLGQSILDVFEIEVNKGKFFEERYTPIYSGDEIIGVTIISQDVTKRISRENELNYLSYHDILTGLKNRTYYQKTLNTINNDEKNPYTVIYVDINGLKDVNDTYGHKYGDELILTVSRELNYEFNGELLLSRIGGDEFVMVLLGKDLNVVRHKMGIVINNLNNFKIQDITPSISYGYSIKEPGDDIEMTIKVAEDLMYENKINMNLSNNMSVTNTLRTMLHKYNIETNEHSIRVMNLAMKIGNKLELPQNMLEDLKIIANFHDIGKIIIPYEILMKEEKLTKEEWEIIKLHPSIGSKVLSSIDEYKHLKDEVLHHHERYDGKGCPAGLKGEEIPLLSRIISVCDSFDAMTHDRPYKKTLTKDEAINELIKEKGKQFDPKIVDVFLGIIN